MIKRALISVSNKTGIVEFAKKLKELEVEIISTGGTARKLVENGIEVTNVSDITGFPECLDGRVKTLHPVIHGGILAVRENENHMKQLKELNIEPIDLLVINLYPFKETILKENTSFEEAIENIDIGGPTMLRAAAKNFKDVIVVVDPIDYEKVINELIEKKEVSYETRYRLALKVFEYTSHYDALISNYLKDRLDDEKFPEILTITYEKVQDLRYGENSHQRAAFYREIGKNTGSLVNAKQISGKELSFNNINDANGALELLKEFDEPTVVAVKHTNPCGVGCGINIYDAYMKAYECDPKSIFGGIIAANKAIDKKTAEEINKIFIEIVIAPDFDEEGLEILKSKKNIRILKLKDIEKKQMKNRVDIKKVSGGILIQDIDFRLYDDLKVVTERVPTEKEMEDLIFAWKVCKHVKSNGIVLAKDKQTVGIGPGQVNRIWALENSIKQAFVDVKGSVMASDAFFPFSDCVEAAAKAGITAIIQPGGSIRDRESIEAADKYGIAMIFTGMRHFKH
ncbi:phosphoribosylaminoimidazolecarboxamide formyltransferase / IMP cyclohydrolase [Caminicella sporogenes DSM 14501]|uniref:Bifunctional purine biosynthesis protein PurH n=1 Tax=Caminicella sporogenes DSM 14501 TaxID=1121266 RepID=A0A1M6RST2_9FIRM|nr:bifunctional phosphoribosylaminoimidazolecarboxamide formyltransferase/IMP cyclohydrolase [Caminicella sporogenes]RKD23657.1 bifunctional phosphoribosylaminoimidazolecarboxamide formyltransferase/IMP cyclohydrolase [Caminicella sporogenes]SHK35490.1 phosphoribosylaminoimidazolecarboxamide formyltransferase / IMP cyclohydrolase [Caminicella sporogenes DSM 14501]